MNQSPKNKVLLLTGIADTFFGKSSPRQFEQGIELADKVKDLVGKHAESYAAFVNVLMPGDVNREVAPLLSQRKQKVINLKLNSKTLLDISNELTFTEEDGSTLLLNGDQLDFILRPSEYEFHILGVDLNGIFNPFITELLNKQYNVYLYSDMIRRFRNTEQFVKGIHNSNFKYCSYRSAI